MCLTLTHHLHRQITSIYKDYIWKKNVSLNFYGAYVYGQNCFLKVDS